MSIAEQNAGRDERLAQLLGSIAAGNGEVDLDAACRDHPDLADELRQLLAVGQIIDICGSASQKTWTGPASEGTVGETLPRVFGDYDLVAELGRGGMGVVYKAWDKKLERCVALKMVLRGRFASDVDLHRFRSEAASAAGLTHPNIVPVFQVGEQDGQAYFCMKYVEGKTLSQVVAEGPLPQQKAARYLVKIARAIEHAHQHGILHRD